MNGLLTPIVSVLLVLLFLATIGMASRGSMPPIIQGMKELRYSKGFQLFSIFFSVFLLFSCYAFFQIAHDPSFQDQLLITSFLLVGGLSSYLLLKEAFLIRVLFDEDGLRKISPWSPSKMQWHQIQTVKYDGSWHAFSLTGPLVTIRVSRYMSGLNEFLRVMDKNVKAEVLKDIRKDLDVFLSE